MSNTIQSISVKDFDGNIINLVQKYKNKLLLIIIYNNDCLGCTGRAIPLAYEFQQQYPTIQVIGIHADFFNKEGTKTTIKNIFTSGTIPFPIYIDEHHKVYDQFNSEGTPQWLLISEKGELLRSIFGSQDNAKNRLYYALESFVEKQ
ncbi:MULTISPECIES: TlpA family protein disulfide reductase [Tenacibaculum]|uniref:TlpA family protein disulfide reductase n=1 Tax=Tenacibaculum TaxID=104267 RepID=UPI001F0AB1DD|nr:MULTISPECIES: redoxin domain-containing protein [Tenacibaculum]MCH3882158.1 redoxin domain-containing protein [Tenacibaculum aquimarinum]MCH3885172.1 redoxin domain-containing protein [Tenacibaculum aquimarinum]MDO6599799.1 redoxin domain-containing protein [Tenacibaculum sp. 1_MG-2023]